MTPTEFKSWRKRCGLTQAQAGDLLGYTQQHICAIERGRFPVTKAIALATIGYEFQEKANDFREMLAFAGRDYPIKDLNDKIKPSLQDLKKIMRDPAYWRDQDPGTVNAVRKAFRDLYSDGHPGLVEDPQQPIYGKFWS